MGLNLIRLKSSGKKDSMKTRRFVASWDRLLGKSSWGLIFSPDSPGCPGGTGRCRGYDPTYGTLQLSPKWTSFWDSSFQACWFRQEPPTMSGFGETNWSYITDAIDPFWVLLLYMFSSLRNPVWLPAVLRRSFPSTTGCFRRKPVPPSRRGQIHKSWSQSRAS